MILILLSLIAAVSFSISVFMFFVNYGLSQSINELMEIVKLLDQRLSRVEIERELDGEEDLTQQMMAEYRSMPMTRRES